MKLAAAVVLFLTTAAWSAEILLPMERSVYVSNEPIEVAAVGVEKGTTASFEIIAGPGTPVVPVKWQITGDGGTVNTILPAGALAPGKYTIKLAGAADVPLTIVAGVPQSTFGVSVYGVPPQPGLHNFIIGPTLTFGLVGGDGQPLRDVRGRRSTTREMLESSLASGLPFICFQYWTGFITHKPWGTEKSWANAEMQEAMRLFNFAAAQRLRRYAAGVSMIGAIDEPGLSWGKTPAGGLSSGYPNWDERPWYESRGWNYTQDIASLPEDQWLKYVQIRSAILGESLMQMNRDVHTVWPEAVISTDAYSPHALMDGWSADTHRASDVPASHVFFDFFGGPMAVTGQIYLEKCHDPTVKIAHGMNGQLVGARGPQLPLYHWLLNGLLAGGVHHNWWHNLGLPLEELKQVNERAARVGPLFRQMSLRDHDIAILVSTTEYAMRCREVIQLESTKTGGQQAKLLLPLLEGEAGQPAEMATSAYEVGQTFVEPLLGLHQSLRRAGYAPQFVHERLAAEGGLKPYKVLFVIGQSANLPEEVRSALAAFVQEGGSILVDSSTTVSIDGAKKLDLDLGPATTRARRWKDAQTSAAAGNKRDASIPATSIAMTEPWRQSVSPLKAALKDLPARPIITTDALDLSAERHVGGEGELRMVLNGHEQYPANHPADQEYPRYNPAPQTATFTLTNVPAGSAVWAIEGNDWRKVTRLDNPATPITASFEPGEMKLYMIAPREPEGITIDSRIDRGTLHLTARLGGVVMPWPLSVRVTGPTGVVLFNLHRATGEDGVYSETLPLGANAFSGNYVVTIESPVGNLTAEAVVLMDYQPAVPQVAGQPARVIDEGPIRSFLASKPAIVVAVAHESHRPAAQRLVERLATKGLSVELKAEDEVVRRASYPRVLNPFVTLYRKTDTEQPPTAAPQREITITPATAHQFRQPNTFAIIGPEGHLDWMNQDRETAFEPGVKVYFDARGQMTVLNGVAEEVKTDEAFRQRWCKPWTKLTPYMGGFQLPPQLPEAYQTDVHLILLGDSHTSSAVAALQASEILSQVVDAKYPGAGKALVQFAWSPFGVEKNLIYIGATDAAGLDNGVNKLLEMLE